MNNNKHLAAGLVAFLIWGFFSLPLRALAGYQAGEILYFRILFAVAILAILIFAFRRKRLQEDIAQFKNLTVDKKRMLVLLTLAGGLLLTVNWLTFIYIVNNINIKTASFSYFVCPVLTAVLGALLLHEKLTRQQWLAVTLCAISCVLIGFGSVQELGYSFLTALTYALYLITQRKNQGFDRVIVLGIQVLFALFVLSFLFDRLVVEVPADTFFYSVIFLIAALFTVVPLFLNLYALNKVNAATIGIIMYINPLLNFGLALLFFNETVGGVQTIGYGLILVALVVFNYSNLRKLTTMKN